MAMSATLHALDPATTRQIAAYLELDGLCAFQVVNASNRSDLYLTLIRSLEETTSSHARAAPRVHCTWPSEGEGLEKAATQVRHQR